MYFLLIIKWGQTFFILKYFKITDDIKFKEKKHLFYDVLSEQIL